MTTAGLVKDTIEPVKNELLDILDLDMDGRSNAEVGPISLGALRSFIARIRADTTLITAQAARIEELADNEAYNARVALDMAARLADAQDKNTAAEAECLRLREALTRSQTALSDWICVYASDMCDENSVLEAQSRIGEHGTLAYIALVQEQNNAALSRSALQQGER